MQVYAQPMSDPSDNLPAVYNCLIEFVAPASAPGRSANGPIPAAAIMQFPKQFGQWRDGCYLYEPLDGLIQQPLSVSRTPSQSMVYFKVNCGHC